MITRIMLVILLLIVACPSFADDGANVALMWFYNWYGYESYSSVHSSDTYTDGYDGEMDVASTLVSIAGFWRENNVRGWNGPTGWYREQRIPVPAIGSSTIISGLYVWQAPSSSRDKIVVYYYGEAPYSNPLEWRRILRLVKIPDGIDYSGDTEWILPLSTTKMNSLLAEFPAYRTDDPLSSYEFEIEIQHLVPEPSSLLALAGGFAGLGGMALKRRGTR